MLLYASQLYKINIQIIQIISLIHVYQNVVANKNLPLAVTLAFFVIKYIWNISYFSLVFVNTNDKLIAGNDDLTQQNTTTPKKDR